MLTVIRGLHNVRPFSQGAIVSIGNFDGIHLGHQHLINHLLDLSKKMGLPSGIILFEPQPNEYFNPTQSTPRLMRLREKLLALAKTKIGFVFILHFDKHLACLSAEDFVEKILVEKLNVKHLVIGDDFHFGHQRKGNIHLLNSLGSQYNFTTEQLPSYQLNNLRISSTRIRENLAEGNLKAAEKLLGRTYGVAGHVAHGDKRGRLLGFPTANLFLHRRSTPLNGVFAVKCFGIEQEPIHGVANIGNRPTVDGLKYLLEIHLLNFQQDIYGKLIYVEFIEKLRDEQRFANINLLKQQISNDIEQAKIIFNL